MNHSVRRQDRLMAPADVQALLQNGDYGILSTVDENGQPYGVPLQYALENNTLYFHCAQQGHKLDNIAHDNRVCFTIVAGVQPVYDRFFTSYYQSVVVFGHAHELTDRAAKEAALTLLCNKYLPDYVHRISHDIAMSIERTAIFAIGIDSVTGKNKLQPPENGA